MVVGITLIKLYFLSILTFISLEQLFLPLKELPLPVLNRECAHRKSQLKLTMETLRISLRFKLETTTQ